MPKPTIKTKCVANNYAGPNETIAEVSVHGSAEGCLIRASVLDDGRLQMNVYQLSDKCIVKFPEKHRIH